MMNDQAVVPAIPVSWYDLIKLINPDEGEFIELMESISNKWHSSGRKKIDGKLYFSISLDMLEKALLKQGLLSKNGANLKKLMKQLVKCEAAKTEKKGKKHFYLISADLLTVMEDVINETYACMVKLFIKDIEKYLEPKKSLKIKRKKGKWLEKDIKLLRKVVSKFYKETGDWAQAARKFSIYMLKILDRQYIMRDAYDLQLQWLLKPDVIDKIFESDEWLRDFDKEEVDDEIKIAKDGIRIIKQHLGDRVLWDTDFNEALLKKVYKLIDVFYQKTESWEEALEKLGQYMDEVKNRPWIIEWLLKAKIGLEWLVCWPTMDRILNHGEYLDWRYKYKYDDGWKVTGEYSDNYLRERECLQRAFG